MERIVFSHHARLQMTERGATEAEIVETIRSGEHLLAKHGRLAYRHNFQYNRKWGGKLYTTKQVMPVVKRERGSVVVITVYTFYF